MIGSVAMPPEVAGAPGVPSSSVPAGRPPAGLAAIELLLRDRAAMLAWLRVAEPRPILAAMIATIAVAMAITGAAIGSYRGGEQIAYAAIKLPLVLLGTAALSAPALSAIGAAVGRRARLSADLALVLSALAFGALLIAACTPLLLLARALEIDYHRMILAAVGVFALGGCAALRMIAQGLAAERGPGLFATLAGLCCVIALVGGQLAWALRPYVVRPRTEDVPFVRAVEGGLLDSMVTSLRSAQGIYLSDPFYDPEVAP